MSVHTLHLHCPSCPRDVDMVLGGGAYCPACHAILEDPKDATIARLEAEKASLSAALGLAEEALGVSSCKYGERTLEDCAEYERNFFPNSPCLRCRALSAIASAKAGG